jgi:hypothetical protein
MGIGKQAKILTEKQLRTAPGATHEMARQNVTSREPI